MIHIALYGSGRWGTAILRTFNDMPSVMIEVVKRGESPTTAPHGVIFATPIATHATLALPFIEQGIPVLIEKPVTGSVEEAHQLLAAAKKTRSLVHVGHVHLHNPAFEKVQKLVPSLGRIRHLSFEGKNNGPFRNDASVIWDWLPHPLSMALALLKTKPQSVQAWGISALHPNDSRQCDIAIVKYEFTDGTALVCETNWLSPEKRTSLSIVGETSSLVYTDTAPQKIALFENMGPTVHNGWVEAHTPSVTYPEYGGGAPLGRELAAFIRAIEQGSREYSELALGVTIVELIAAAEQSIVKGGETVHTTSI